MSTYMCVRARAYISRDRENVLCFTAIEMVDLVCVYEFTIGSE